MTEDENIEYIIRMLSKDFVCILEHKDKIREPGKGIHGKHPTGKNLYIDALIRPKDSTKWRNGKRTCFGIEFKRNYDKGGKLIKHIAQSIDYAHSEWRYDNTLIGKIPILIYPSPSQFDDDKTYSNGNKIDHPYKAIDNFIVRLLGSFNIGTIEVSRRTDWKLRKQYELLQIKMSDASLYRSDIGVSENSKNHKLELKVGSR
jgi:hypothetical protein